jgi:carboxyl-terminal processing protease
LTRATRVFNTTHFLRNQQIGIMDDKVVGHAAIHPLAQRLHEQHVAARSMQRRLSQSRPLVLLLLLALFETSAARQAGITTRNGFRRSTAAFASRGWPAHTRFIPTASFLRSGMSPRSPMRDRWDGVEDIPGASALGGARSTDNAVHESFQMSLAASAAMMISLLVLLGIPDRSLAVDLARSDAAVWPGTSISTSSHVPGPHYRRSIGTHVKNWLRLQSSGDKGSLSRLQPPSSLLVASSASASLGDSSFVVATSQASPSVVDDVWELVNKYSLDRSFQGQNWDAIHREYQQKVATLRQQNDEQPDVTAEMKLATQMIQTLNDKYTRILDAASYTAIQKYDLIGVGVTLMPDPVSKQIMVGSPPIANSAADRSGLRVGDYIVAVNGVSTAGRTAFSIIDQISEDPSAPTVTFSVVRPAATVATADSPLTSTASVATDAAATAESSDNTAITSVSIDSGSLAATPQDIVLERQLQKVKDPVEYKMTETRDGDKIGYIRIKEFNAIVKNKLENAITSLLTASNDEAESSGATALVLDLRSNGGGAFQSAVEIAGLFMNDRLATNVVDGTGAALPFKTAANTQIVPASVPVVIWTDPGTASASEVLAGALHDNCRAVLMGDRSFGKGLIQAVYGLPHGDGGGLVLTVARYETPNGTNIQGVGITPDIPGHVPLPLPGLISDTSKVDFEEVRHRLDPQLCHVPS